MPTRSDLPSPRRARVSLRDVARAAGVSTGTASNALNDKGRVDPATRAAVVATAQRLGYRANRAARNLRRGSTGILAFAHDVASDSPSQLAGIDYFVQVLTAAAEAAAREGYALVFSQLADEGALADVQFDGALVVDPERASGRVERLAAHGVPTVTVGRVPDRPRDEGWWVDNDLDAATVRILDLLAARGAEAVTMLTMPPTRSYSADEIAGYERWCAARGVEARVVVVDGTASEASAYRAALPLLDGPARPDAIYAPLDRLAVGVQLAASAIGLAVPGDLLVAAGSDSESTRTASPPITALALHPDRLGQAAVELLVERLRGEDDAPPRQVLVDVDVEERASTAGAR